MHEERFVDLPPAQVWAQVLDAGQVPPCSIRTMYRVLAANAEVRERRNQLRHPAYHKPELLATGPNQVWSWDITKLLGPVKWTYYYLYVLLDIFSRYVVGWLLARQESAALAKVLITESCERQHIAPDQLIIHADRGPSMTSQPVALLLATLGVVPSHSRPHVSNDNPFSEAQFKTLKYRPDFPDRFGVLRGCRDVRPAVLPVVQPRASSRRPGPDDAPRYALRPGRGQVAAARRGPARRLRGPPGALPARGAGPAAPADGGVDQQAPGGAGSCRARGDRLMTADSQISDADCLIPLDNFRRADATASAPQVQEAQLAARSLTLETVLVEVKDGSYERAFSTVSAERADALFVFVTSDPQPGSKAHYCPGRPIPPASHVRVARVG